MAQRLPLTHPDESAAFARARERIKALQAERARSEDAARETSTWKALVFTIKEKTRIPVVSNFNINYIYEPRDVIIAAERAALSYEEKGSVLHNPFRALARVVGDNHTFMEMFLEFIPDGEYTSILCGALTLLLSAAAQVSKARKSIIECLAGLNGRFQDSEDWLQLYNNEADYIRLWDAAENMYVAVLQASQNMICWLDESAWKHFKGSMKFGGGYSDAVKAQTKALIDQEAVKFDSMVKYCLHVRLAKTFDTVTQTDAKVDKVLQQNDDIQRLQIENDDKMMVSQKQVEGSLVRLLQDMQKMMDTQAAQHASIQAMLEAKATAMSTELSELKRAAVQQRPKFILRSGEMLDVLKVPFRSCPTDMEHAQLLFTMLSASSRSRAANIMRNPFFHDWLTGPNSGALLLNGMDVITQTQASATTYCITRVHEALIKQQVAISLTFLCTPHMQPGDVLYGPVGMLRSLCAQLLQASPVELELALDDGRLLIDATQRNVVALTSLFRMLLAELARKVGRMVVVVMVDDISLMEDDTEVSEMFSSVILQLVAICVEVKNLTNPLILKMLFASKVVSSKVDRLFPDEGILTMQMSLHSGISEPLAASEFADAVSLLA